MPAWSESVPAHLGLLRWAPGCGPLWYWPMPPSCSGFASDGGWSERRLTIGLFASGRRSRSCEAIGICGGGRSALLAACVDTDWYAWDRWLDEVMPVDHPLADGMILRLANAQRCRLSCCPQWRVSSCVGSRLGRSRRAELLVVDLASVQ